mmetsp:Transcript_53442/g.140960  ORF Transcript_53442/g.140960 Transcript_53442/m.140960 type:complete len:209 (+) Transcript_53442:392-1018(+)
MGLHRWPRAGEVAPRGGRGVASGDAGVLPGHSPAMEGCADVRSARDRQDHVGKGRGDAVRDVLLQRVSVHDGQQVPRRLREVGAAPVRDGALLRAHHDLLRRGRRPGQQARRLRRARVLAPREGGAACADGRRREHEPSGGRRGRGGSGAAEAGHGLGGHEQAVGLGRGAPPTLGEAHLHPAAGSRGPTATLRDQPPDRENGPGRRHR